MSKGFHRLAPDVPWSNSTSPLASVGQITVPMREALKLGEVMAARAALEFDPPTAEGIVSATGFDPFTPGPGTMSKVEAKLSGYTGDQCSICGSVRMRIAGHCQVCESCGNTTGCS